MGIKKRSFGTILPGLTPSSALLSSMTLGSHVDLLCLSFLICKVEMINNVYLAVS